MGATFFFACASAGKVMVIKCQLPNGTHKSGNQEMLSIEHPDLEHKLLRPQCLTIGSHRSLDDRMLTIVGQQIQMFEQTILMCCGRQQAQESLMCWPCFWQTGLRKLMLLLWRFLLLAIDDIDILS